MLLIANGTGEFNNMILDNLSVLNKKLFNAAVLRKILNYLKNTDLMALPSGSHEIDGDNIYAVVFEGAPVKAARLEAHRRYIDAHLLVSGRENIGWAPVKKSGRISNKYDSKKDVMFFAGRPLCLLTLNPGDLAVFYPSDAHAPLCGGSRRIKKLIFKIRVN